MASDRKIIIKRNQNQSDNLIQLGSQLRNRLFKEKQQFKKSSASLFNNSLHKSQSYILSFKFINQWKAFTKYDENDLKNFDAYGKMPQKFNEDLLKRKNSEQYQMLPDLVQNKDYWIVNKAIMNIFKQYKGIKIKYSNKEKKQIIEQEIKLQYIFFSQLICYSIDKNVRNPLQIKTVNISNLTNLEQLKNTALTLYFQKQDTIKQIDDIRIWKMNSSINISKFISQVKNIIKSQNYYDYLIPPSGTIFEDDNLLLKQFEIDQSSLMIFEIKTKKKWVFKHKGLEEHCPNCNSYKILKFICECKNIKYCSQMCKQQDYIHHSSCYASIQIKLKDQKCFIFNPSSKKGLVGLENLGNTCFLNSCLQCLSNTQILTQYFLSSKFLRQINKTNVVGTGGKLSLKYAQLIKQLWCESNSTASPSNLKQTIQQFQPMFAGNNQHDAQQLLSYLLDGLHEDLNRVLIKPFLQQINTYNRIDKVIAKQSWQNYFKRNQSIIVDVLIGQYKSKVICPDCKFESITFDSFSNVSVPIPKNPWLVVQSFVCFQSYKKQPKKLIIYYKTESLDEWYNYVSETLNINKKQLKAYFLSFQYEIQQLDDKMSTLDIKNKIQKQKKKIFFLQQSEEQCQIQLHKRIQINFSFITIKKQQIKKLSLSVRRPFYFNMKKDITGFQIYFKIFKYLYHAFGPFVYKSEKFNIEIDNKKLEERFRKIFEKKQNYIFQIFLMTNKVIKQDRKVIYNNQKLIDLNDNLKIFLYTNKIPFQLEIRITEKISSAISQSNIYPQFPVLDKNANNTQCEFIDCLRAFRRKQKLSQGNEWYCPKCKKHRQAIKQISIYKTSKILIFHLKRFQQKSDLIKKKVTTLIKYPFVLELDEFLIQKTLPQSYFQVDKEKIIQSSKYELYAVCNHFGQMGKGHYTAYVKNNNNWYQFDDSTISKISEKQVISSAAYILFYKRM